MGVCALYVWYCHCNIQWSLWENYWFTSLSYILPSQRWDFSTIEWTSGNHVSNRCLGQQLVHVHILHTYGPLPVVWLFQSANGNNNSLSKIAPFGVKNSGKLLPHTWVSVTHASVHKAIIQGLTKTLFILDEFLTLLIVTKAWIFLLKICNMSSLTKHSIELLLFLWPSGYRPHRAL